MMKNIPYDITFHPSWYHKFAGIDFNKRFFEDPVYRIACDCDMRRCLFEHFGEFGIGEKDPAPRPVLGSDLLACGYLYSAILGCEINYRSDSSPEVICAEMDEEAVLKLKMPDLQSNALWQNQEAQISYLLNKYGFVLPEVNLMGIQNIALDLRGKDLFFDYIESPGIADHLLNVCTQLSIEAGKRYTSLSEYVSGGVTGIVKKVCPSVYLTSNCTEEMISNEMYEKFLLKYDNMLADVFTDFGIHHCGQTMEHIVQGYSKVKNLKFAEVGAFSDLAAVRKALPDVFLNARYSPVRLKTSDSETVKSDIAKIYQDGSPLELLSVSCVGIDSETPDGKVINFLSAAMNGQ